jgi:hypothetical protein
MAYVKAGGRGQQPQTTLDNCLRLLLASHYLQVGQLLQSFLLHADLHDCAPILVGLPALVAYSPGTCDQQLGGPLTQLTVNLDLLVHAAPHVCTPCRCRLCSSILRLTLPQISWPWRLQQQHSSAAWTAACWTNWQRCAGSVMHVFVCCTVSLRGMLAGRLSAAAAVNEQPV